MKTFERGLVLKQRPRATWKWPIRYSGKTSSAVWLYLYRNDDLIREITTKEGQVREQAKRYS